MIESLTNKVSEKWNDISLRKRRIISGVASLAVGSLIYTNCIAGEEGSLWNRIYYADSKLRHGVQGQLEEKEIRVDAGNKGGQYYYVKLEMCQQDIDAALAGDSGRLSVDMAVGKVGVGCFKDVTEVSHAYWNKVDLGQIITFRGDPRTHLNK